MGNCSSIKCKVYDVPNNIILPLIFRSLEDTGIEVKQVKSNYTQIVGEILYYTNQKDIFYVIVAPLFEPGDHKESSYLVAISLTIDTAHDIGRNKMNLDVFYRHIDNSFGLLFKK